MLEHVNTIVAAVVAFVVAILIAITPAVKRLFLAYIKRFEDKITRSSNKIAYRNGIERLAEFHTVLEDIRDLEYVQRVLVLVGKNCGGTPQPGKAYTVEALHGWSQRENDHPEKLYNYAMRVDAYYIEMILKLIQDGWAVNKTATMPPKALLTGLYLQEGVIESLAFCVNLTDNELIFLSVANYERSFTEGETAKIMMYLTRLRSIFTTTVSTPEISV